MEISSLFNIMEPLVCSIYLVCFNASHEDLTNKLSVKPQCQCASRIRFSQDHIHHKSIFYTLPNQGNLSISLPQGNASLHPRLYQKGNLTPLNKINQGKTGVRMGFSRLQCAGREPFSHLSFLNFSALALAV